MAELLLSPEWVEMLSHFNTLYVGFSGGLDSTVLLRALCAEPALVHRVKAVHVHHGLSAHADAWEAHCAQVCADLSVPLTVKHVHLPARDNLEERARLARHQVFTECLEPTDCLVLGHHQNDQAETLLLRLFRGSGVEGLAGMRAFRPFATGMLARPLLSHSRARLEAFAEAHALRWVEDESNTSEALSRNFIRHSVLPLLAQRYSTIVETLARSTLHFEAAQSNLEALAHNDCPWLSTAPNPLPVASLTSLSPFRRDNVLRTWLRAQAVRMPSTAVFQRIAGELLSARADATPCVSWGNVALRSYRGALWLLPKAAETARLTPLVWDTFPDPLTLQDGRGIQVLPAGEGVRVPAGVSVHVRFRVSGESLRWRGQTKTLKKLFQEWGVPPWERARVPLVYVNEELAAVVGFAVADDFFCQDGGWAFEITQG